MSNRTSVQVENRASLAPILIESLRDNNGRRSVTRLYLHPGRNLILHYHTEFEETFEVLEGEFTVWHAKTNNINAGQSSRKIKLKETHRFKNQSQQIVIANVIVEPGHAGCEDVNKILAGLEKEANLMR